MAIKTAVFITVNGTAKAHNFSYLQLLDMIPNNFSKIFLSVALPLNNASVKNPIFSPDGQTLLWFQRKSGGPHASCMSLMKTSAPLNEKVLKMLS